MSVSTVTYPLSLQHWRSEGAIQVYDKLDHRLCSIPIGSLRTSGDLNWQYVFYCVRTCVDCEGRLFLAGACADGVEVDPNSSVEAGKYVFLPQGAKT